MSGTHEKDPANVARGLKAAIHNPRVSEEAKMHDIERLHEMGETVDTERPEPESKEYSARLRDTSSSTTYDVDHNPNRVLGGYKAALHNPHTSQAAKEHAEEVLDTKDT